MLRARLERLEKQKQNPAEAFLPVFTRFKREGGTIYFQMDNEWHEYNPTIYKGIPLELAEIKSHDTTRTNT